MLLSAALLAGITLLALVQARRQPWLLVGWLWFVGTLVPVIGLVQVGDQARADRYVYIPHIGLFLALVWGARRLVERFGCRSWSRPGWRRLLCSPLPAPPGSRSATGATRKPSGGMPSRSPDNHRAHYRLGLMASPADAPLDPKGLEQARKHFAAALVKNPRILLYRQHLITVLVDQGNLDEPSKSCGKPWTSTPGWLLPGWPWRACSASRARGKMPWRRWNTPRASIPTRARSTPNWA